MSQKDFIDKIRVLSERTKADLDHLETEEATKNALILPFIDALGYDIWDVTEVIPEFSADFGHKKGEKVDYAIVINDQPQILFECKHAHHDLSNKHISQLYRYFNTTGSKIGVLTNGLEYRFYTDLEKSNTMDSNPYLVIDIRNFDQVDDEDYRVKELRKLSKSYFNLDNVLSAAHDLKYRRALMSYLSEQFDKPSDDFTKFLMGQVYEGRRTKRKSEKFKSIVRKTLQQLIDVKMDEVIERGRNKDIQDQPDENSEDVADNDNTSENKDGIVTTDEELEAFRIIRAIMREVVKVERVTHRDVKTYFGVLLDDNNRKPICRLHLDGTTKYIGLMDEDKNENRVEITTLDDIYDYRKELQKTVGYYD
jgi:hypothetical protein